MNVFDYHVGILIYDVQVSLEIGLSFIVKLLQLIVLCFVYDELELLKVSVVLICHRCLFRDFNHV